MNLEIFLALVGFALVTSMTPGPNNIMLLASGVNFGFKRTLWHMTGIFCGFAFMLICIAFGLGSLFEAAPYLFLALKISGGCYLLYLAYRIAMSGPVDVSGSQSKPLGLFGAAVFQAVNPKAWVVALTSIAAYTDVSNFAVTTSIVAAVMLSFTIISVTSWTAFGTALSRLLSNPKTLRRFNLIMALLLVASLWPMLR